MFFLRHWQFGDAKFDVIKHSSVYTRMELHGKTCNMSLYLQYEETMGRVLELQSQVKMQLVKLISIYWQVVWVHDGLHGNIRDEMFVEQGFS